MYSNTMNETTENTVITEYTPTQERAENYQSEAELEQEFIKSLIAQGYEYAAIHNEHDLIKNLRVQIEKLNQYKFTEKEWQNFFTNYIAKGNESFIEKTFKVHEDNICALKRDNGTTQNIKLLDLKNISNNRLQVINQYAVSTAQGARYNNRYDVTILVNGLPLVHIELKRRGVAIREAFNQIKRYSRDSFGAGSGLFNYVQIFVISNGTNTKYYSNTTRNDTTKNNFEFASNWADAANKIISDLSDFAKTFFAPNTLLNILIKYCVFTSEKNLLVMRPYQIAATEQILNKIKTAYQNKNYGSIEAGGYIWHTTGSGKTLTSFKTAQLATKLDFIDKVLFVVDRKDLDNQTMREYDKFEKGAANGNASTKILERQLADPNARIIITTIQKLSTFIKRNHNHEIYNRQVVIIFDECHRSQFGEMHKTITDHFKQYYMFGFTGTPIFAINADTGTPSKNFTTEQTFGEKLHTYTIIDAINDKNVLPFRVDFVSTMKAADEIEDEDIIDIDRKKIFEAPARIHAVAKYILEHFDQKTYNRQFNSILAVSSVPMAKKYYHEFKQIDTDRKLKIVVIYSCAVNTGNIVDEENSEDTSGLDKADRDFLQSAINDYNKMFQTNYDADAEKFQNYYKNVSERMKHKEIDLLIVVNMFLTGFDAPTLNTLWVDKNLKFHGLIQSFSRTNRILNSVKTFGNVICFRNLKKRVDEALALFGNKDAKGVVTLKPFGDYYGEYKNLVDALKKNFPVTDSQITGEQKRREFIKLFGAILRQKNILKVFDEFNDKEILSERDFQDYLGKYQDLHEEFKKRSGETADVTGDIIFETELVEQIEINIDYILKLVQKYYNQNCEDEEILITIQKAVAASPELRSKKDLIEKFIKQFDPTKEINTEWNNFVAVERETELNELINSQRLNIEETFRFLENAFIQGKVKIFGTGINTIMPPVSRFGGNRAQIKKIIVEVIQKFFEKYFGIGEMPNFGSKNI